MTNKGQFNNKVFYGNIQISPHSSMVIATTFSVIDFLSAAGGMIMTLRFVFMPIAQLFSDLDFNIGVINMLFDGRIILDADPKDSTT